MADTTGHRMLRAAHQANSGRINVQQLIRVLTAAAEGDFSVRMPKDQVGIAGKIADSLNQIIESNQRLVNEFDRIGTVVGKEGRTSQRIELGRAGGGWADCIRSVNTLVSDLVQPTAEMGRVIGAVARGDLAQTMAVEIEGRPLKGEFLGAAKVVNTMVDQLNSFASEVTRVAREVGTEGKLGGQAQVRGVSGVWKDLTDNVNFMAGNLTAQVRNIADVTTAVAKGDLSKKITVDVRGEILQLKDTINTMVDQLRSFASEVTRVAREVGTEGRLGGQAVVPGVDGVWKDLTDNVNLLAGNLTTQVRNIAEVTTAVAGGDLAKKISVDVKGEILELKNTINTMVDQLNSFASEVTRVAREVGTEGKLGGQAQVRGVSGVWKDLTDSVNSMASNLTAQVRNIADVTTAVANGDLSKKITVDVKGEILELKNTINIMVDQLSGFASEVTRVAREVGTDGKLGGQAEVRGVSGTWKDLTDNVNLLAGNLTTQVRNIAGVTTAVAKGDLTQKITVDARGEILELKNTINTMVGQLNSFASEVTRVAREVGTDGKLAGQANVPDVAGTWKDLTDSVNSMASNLTAQVRNIAEVTTAVATGDLSKKITVDVKGEILELKNTINIMVDQLNSFASEVTRVAREVATDGRLGGQAEVRGVSGVWKDLTDNVNLLAGNLTAQVRNIAGVTTAVAKGDLTQKITVDARGEILELKNTINTMVDQLNSFAAEVTRVAREVGTEGKLGGQADVRGVAGTWKDLTDNVNLMAGNLTGQVRNIAEVTTAVATGDLSKKITVDVKGEILELKNTINTMVDQLNSFASEVTRVAREVGTEGKLGGQAEVRGVSGVWKDLTDNVNFMASNLTAQVRNIAEVTTAVASGHLAKKITVDVRGEILELKDTINTMVDQLNSFASEVTRVAREVGTEGKLGGQAQVRGVSGGVWKDLTDNVNLLAGNLTTQVRNIAAVTTAVAKGDLTQKITVDVKGEILELKNTINTMVDQLNSFASEVTRVAREVGTEGKLGGQAQVRGVSGVWKDLTDNVNIMAANLTDQVRGIAKVVTAVANGNLRQRLTVEAKGEIAALAETINGMSDTLATFAEQVTTVAREVGVEGKLGGQASVPGAAGTWKDLTDNVNQLAANLTTQVRAIADVATAVTKGDLTRSIKVEARGEVAELKDNINEMIRNLQETTQKNSEQDWLKTNLAKFTRLLQGQRDLLAVSGMILSELAPLVSVQHGVFYTMENPGGDGASALTMAASFAYKERKNLANRFKIGEGLVGQCAFEKQPIFLSNVPGDYVRIASGLGEAPPLNIAVLPVVFEKRVLAVFELASFERFSDTHRAFLEQLTESIGIVLNTIQANMRTETLLAQSQSLAQELQSQQEELRQTNEQLEEKAHLLSEQKAEVERKSLEVEQGRRALEEKAEQLALTSKYKSQFLSNMSHELRTPLNSLLILSQQLAENPHQNLTERQVEFARTIHSSGNDLLALINDILDLSKIESGTVTLEVSEVRFATVSADMQRLFRHVAEGQGLEFAVEVAPDLPEGIHTDAKRLEQVLKNLLSNAFKFTERGRVALRMATATSGWSLDREGLNRARSVVAFAVADTGIGIPADKQKIIFEAFQQADGSTSRKYGGTGLGLSISREIAKLLGGDLAVESASGEGSTFTLYLPMAGPDFAPPRRNSKSPGGGPSVASPSEGLAAGAPAAAASSLVEVSEDRKELDSRLRGNDDMRGALECGSLLPPSSGQHAGHGEENPASKLAGSKRQQAVALQSGHEPGGIEEGRAIVDVSEDRAELGPEDRTLLIVEDDLNFAKVLLGIAREGGFKGIVASRGESALALARRYQPSAIALDLILPDLDGLTVLEWLKLDPVTRHIPVYVITVREERERALGLGALGVSIKPVSRQDLKEALDKLGEFISRPKRLLVVDDDPVEREYVMALVGGRDIEVVAAASGEEALAALKDRRFDCVLLDLSFPGMSGRNVMEAIQQDSRLRDLPVIVHTGRDLMGNEELGIRKMARAIVVKDARSHESLLQQTALYLHRRAADLPKIKQGTPEGLGAAAPVLAGKKLLVVDDDARNIFALSAALECHNLQVISAENGKVALEVLAKTPDIQAVLMDIMMPEMDGYATMRAIREMPRFSTLPIIALTARAMKEDRKKCLEAGASDYIPKPVDIEQLLSLLRLWMDNPERGLATAQDDLASHT